MPKEAKKRYLTNRDQMVFKNMHFNRFLLLRYSLALFFFSNLYWLFTFVVIGSGFWFIPLADMLLSVSAVYEQVKLNGLTRKDVIPLSSTKRYFFVQTTLNIILILLNVLPWGMTALFSFIANTREGWFFLNAVLLVGALLGLLNIRRMKQIENNSDRTLEVIIDFEKTYGKENKRK